MVMGLGVGFSMSPDTEAITGSLPEERQGVASALNDTVREFGGALGVALIGSLLSAGYSGNIGNVTVDLPAGAASAVKEGIGGALTVAPTLGDRGPVVVEAARQAFVHGWQLAMWVAAGLLVVAAAFTAGGSPVATRRPPTSRWAPSTAASRASWSWPSPTETRLAGFRRRVRRHGPPVCTLVDGWRVAPPGSRTVS